MVSVNPRTWVERLRRPAGPSRGPRRGVRQLWGLWRAGGPTARRGGPRASLCDEVFLRRLERLALALQRPPTAGLSGDHRGRRYNDAPEFADYRTYTPGDDFRRVDWKAYARLGALYYRLGEAQEDLALHILVDVSPSMDWGAPNKLDYARQLAAALGYLGLARFDAVGVGTLGPGPLRLPPLRGKAQAGRLFAYLESLGADAPAARGRPRRPLAVGATGDSERREALDPYSLLESLRTYRRGATRGVVMLLTDAYFPDDRAAALGELLGAGWQPVLLHLLSPQELEPDLAGDLELIDRETDEPVPASLTPETLARYRARLHDWCGELEHYCSARRIPYVRLSTATPLEEAVLGELRRRRLLA